MTVSAGGNRVPNYQREMAEMRAEIRKLWQALGRQQQGPPVQKQMPFTWAGFVATEKTSGIWYAEQNLTITGCTLGFQEAGSSNTVVQLLIDGVSVYTFTLFAGQRRGGTQMRQQVSLGARVQLQVSGGSGFDLTAFLSYVTDGGL